MKRKCQHFRMVLFLACACVALVCGARPPAPGDSSTPASKRPARRVAFKYWPQVRFDNVRILYANTEFLANQGFAGARPEEFERTVMVFPAIAGAVSFTNVDQGFGPVVRDLKIVYLDRNSVVLREEVMKKRTGTSMVPPNAAMAIEGLP